MSFIINFMYNNEPMNKITKTPTGVFDVEGVLRDESSIVDPIILVECDNPITANYAYIAEFNRYYYITDIVSVRNGLWRITMHTDVLKTFSEGILGSPCVVGKSSNRFNMYLNDSSYKLKQNDLISVQAFPSGFDAYDACFVLTLLGNRTQTPPPV